MGMKTGIAAVLCATAASVCGVAIAASGDDDSAGILKDERHFREQALKDYSGGSKAGSAVKMEVVGHNDLGARGFNADVWTHRGFAYVGHWGFTDWATGNRRFCPTGADSGVAVLTREIPRARLGSRRCRTRRAALPRTSSCIAHDPGRTPAMTSPSRASSRASDRAYSDGVRVIDTSNPRGPREVASFVPPATVDPVKPSQRGTLTNTTQVWGVVVDEATGLIYASDMNSGLWILRRTDR